MVNLAKVYIWGEYAGAVLWNENTASATFEYEPSFVNKGWDLSPLMMPINENRAHSFRDLSKDTFMGLPGLLADALPDAYGKALLDRWLVSLGRTFANPVERLCYQSKRSMGALEFIPAKDDYLDKSSVIEISSLVQVAAEVLSDKSNLETNLKEDTKEALINIIKVSTSAGGQRAKAVIAYNDITGEVRSGQLDAAEGFDHWLLKLDGVTNAVLGDPQHYGKIEYAYYKMALKAGIEMTECRLLEENGRSHFMTKRFDRKGGNEKIHMQTLCGIAHYDYKMLHAYSYEQAFQVMRRLRLPYGQAEQMFKRMVFNVIARNQDDHTKNISFLMDRTGTWMLSPAYDMSWAYNPQGEWTSHHQMSINNKWDNITRTDLLAVAEAMHIKKADSIINEICDAVSMWPIVAKELDIPYNMIAMIDDTLLYRSY
ncbi:MAG: type II toxin-antitoxin system HipA family toxin [Paludibacteraceae bacterium]|nr:type II toxin-antitoxin system HipA family toxin [Paludibacteraceae bacterium]